MNPPHSFDAIEHLHAAASFQVAPSTIIPRGNLVARNASGDAVLAADAAGLTLYGIAWPNTVDTTHDISGMRQTIDVRGGIFRFENSSAAPVQVADLGKWVFVEDERTVASATTHSVAAGVAVGLDGAAHVWLWMAAPGAFPGATNIGGA